MTKDYKQLNELNHLLEIATKDLSEWSAYNDDEIDVELCKLHEAIISINLKCERELVKDMLYMTAQNN